MISLTGKAPTVCPECGEGRLVQIEEIKPVKRVYYIRTG